MQGDFTLAKLYLTLVEPCDLIVAELFFLMTLLLEYFGECTILKGDCSIRVSR